jgi:hypothetical protein
MAANKEVRALNRSAAYIKSNFTRNANWLGASSTLYADGLTRVSRAKIEDSLTKLTISNEKMEKAY